MDTLEQLDWGVNYHFTHTANHHPDFVPVMQIAYYISSYVGVGVLSVVAALLFLFQRKRRSALVALTSMVASLLLIEAIHFVLPRSRPEDAQNFLGPDDMLGSYPATSVFLFSLCVIMLGFALWNLLGHAWQRRYYVILGLLLTTWVCLSQLFLRLHFMTDVIGGITGAALISWIAWLCLDPPCQQHGKTTEAP